MSTMTLILMHGRIIKMLWTPIMRNVLMVNIISLLISFVWRALYIRLTYSAKISDNQDSIPWRLTAGFFKSGRVFSLCFMLGFSLAASN